MLRGAVSPGIVAVPPLSSNATASGWRNAMRTSWPRICAPSTSRAAALANPTRSLSSMTSGTPNGSIRLSIRVRVNWTPPVLWRGAGGAGRAMYSVPSHNSSTAPVSTTLTPETSMTVVPSSASNTPGHGNLGRNMRVCARLRETASHLRLA